MLTKGVPEKFLDLTFVIMEAGLGWIPFLIRRYEQHSLMLREDAPLLEKSLHGYVDDQFYFTSQPIEGAAESEYIAQVVQLFNGSDNLLFASDWPHMDFDTTKQLYRSLSAEFDDELPVSTGKRRSWSSMYSRWAGKLCPSDTDRSRRMTRRRACR